jgi:predicted dienelactone hydrolase
LLWVPAFVHAAAEPAPANLSQLAISSSLYKSTAGPWTILVRDEEWVDLTRNRHVPVRIYFPSRPVSVTAGDSTRRPVIVMSHGWGSSRAGYAYFCQHLASWGYLVIAPTHLGSDASSIAWGHMPANLLATSKRETLMQSISDPDNLRNRPRDISFVIDELSLKPELAGIADLTRVGVAGHSFGAYTTMAVAGMRVDLPEARKQSFLDPRVKAVLPMSPEGSGLMGITPDAWNQFAVPALFMVGTRDIGPGLRPASWRHEPYLAIHTVPTWMVTLLGATHLSFARPSAEQAALVESLSTAFFDSELSHLPAAAKWLANFCASQHAECEVDHRGGLGRGQ